jgi:hypothetical protein
MYLFIATELAVTGKAVVCDNPDIALGALVCLGSYNKIPQAWWLIVYKQQTLMPHSSGVWGIQDGGTGRLGVW